MAPILKNTRITILTSPTDPLYPTDKKWTRENLTKWIDNAGGRVLQKYTDSSTHVVCSEKAWKNRGVGDVKAAWEAKQRGNRVFIVGPEWLEKSLRNQKREKESAYAWDRILPCRRSGKGKKKGSVYIAAAAEEEEDEVVDGVGEVEEGPKTTSGLLTQAFQEHTESRMTEREKAEMVREAEAQREAVAKAERERLEREVEERRKRREREAVFRRGARRGQAELLSENQHIYADATGFKYDVTLTKIDPRQNRNERFILTLQLYETNTLPHTYSMTLHFAGTSRHPSNNLICAQGTIFPTALHAFKTVFKEKTLVPWDDRIAFAVARSRYERGLPLNFQDGEAGDLGLSEAVLGRLKPGLDALGDESGTPWEQRPFAYHPPRYGPRGVLPEGMREIFPEVGPRLEQGARGLGTKKRGDIEMWMSGAREAGVEEVDSMGRVDAEGEGEGGNDFIHEKGKGPRDPRQEAETDYDRFAAHADSASVAIGEDFGLGDTSYPFPVGAEDGLSSYDFQAAGKDVHNNAQQQQDEPSPETAPEAHDLTSGAGLVGGESCGHTQLAQDAAAGLEEFMAGLQEAAAAVGGGGQAEHTGNVDVGDQQSPSQGQEQELDRRYLSSSSPEAEGDDGAFASAKHKRTRGHGEGHEDEGQLAQKRAKTVDDGEAEEEEEMPS